MTMKINILNAIEIRIGTKDDPVLPDGDIYVDQGEGGKFRWFVYHSGEYQGHCSRGFDKEHQAWADARRLMRDYKFRYGIPKP